MILKNKVALVTGSSRGIGKATALLFAKEGATVIVNYSKSKKEATQTLNEVNTLSNGIMIKCDVSKEKEVKKMVDLIIKKFGKIDIVINNAGVYLDGDEWNGSSKVWEKTLNFDLISAMNVSKYATLIFLKQKSGSIVNIASRFSTSGQFNEIAYSAAKAGIVSITQSYSKLLSPFGRANAISPGPVRTGYWLKKNIEEELKEALKNSKIKRLIEPEEVAQKVLYLVSDESKNINGQNILLQ